jgi:hypothetical protein
MFALRKRAGSGKIECCRAECLGGIRMTNWKADFDALVEETMSFVRNTGVEPAPPQTIVEPLAPRVTAEPSRLPPVSLPKSERDEIRERVSNFKAHQTRVAREREEYAASLLKRMLDPMPTPPANQSD